MGLPLAVEGAQGHVGALFTLDAFHPAVADRDVDAFCRANTGICSVRACFQALVDEAGEQVSRWSLEFSHTG